MNRAEEQIRKTISEQNLISYGDHIVIGLSGGPDSVCLFHVLFSMCSEMDLTIHAVHLNHKFRPGAAEADQKYVEDLCRKLGVQETTFTVDCSALAKELGMTGEEAGRKARYDAFFETAEKVTEEFCGGNPDFAYDHVKIAVAHNANDQAETILFRLLRGTGTDGLAGMAYEREETRNDRTYKIIRPLLDTWRYDIEKYCEEQELAPVIDHTNNEEIYSRNRIRLDLIPYLEEKYNENIMDGMLRLGRIAAQDRDYFRYAAMEKFDELRIMKDRAGTAFGDDMIVLDRQGLADCHLALRHRVMLKAFGDLGLTRDITAERIDAADVIIEKKQGEKYVEFPHGYRLTVARGKVSFERRK